MRRGKGAARTAERHAAPLRVLSTIHEPYSGCHVTSLRRHARAGARGEERTDVRTDALPASSRRLTARPQGPAPARAKFRAHGAPAWAFSWPRPAPARGTPPAVPPTGARSDAPTPRPAAAAPSAARRTSSPHRSLSLRRSLTARNRLTNCSIPCSRTAADVSASALACRELVRRVALHAHAATQRGRSGAAPHRIR